MTLFFFIIISCRFPYKIVPNLPPTPSLQETATLPLPAVSTQTQPESNQETPTVEIVENQVEIKPESGSDLTWSDYSSFVYIPSGEFEIGKNSYTPIDHSPVHKVSLSGFWIQQAEVTNQQYAQCVDEGKCSVPIQEPDVPYWYEDPYNANHPVVGVTWFQAREYCSYIQSRLPTEAEWEAAARGGNSKIFPWGGDKPNCNYLIFSGCLQPAEPYDIGSFINGISDFGLLDMAGNVFEWVEDWYDAGYYSSAPYDNPTGPLDGRKKVYRGGSYKSAADEITSYLRFSKEPEKQAPDIGFRCVLADEPTKNLSMQIGQPCQVSAINDQLQTKATITPFPCSSAIVTGFCQLFGDIPSYGIELRQTGCLDNNLHSMTSNSQPLTCKTSDLSNGGNLFRCTFPGMAQGIKVDVSYCHSLDIQKAAKSCPVGYVLDQGSSNCVLENSKLPSPPCPKGFLDLSPYGCLPVNDLNGTGCPIGFYSFKAPSSSVCMPLNECLLSDAPNTCMNNVCEEGQRFNSSKGCCDSPDLPKKVCPSNLLYNADQKMCMGSELYPKDCEVEKIKIPYCPTLTPTPTPVPVPQSVPLICSDYKDPEVCKMSGCKWAVGLFYCY